MINYSLTCKEPCRPKRLRFGLFSAEEIARLSVCRVTETTLYYRGLPASGGLLDPLMGTVDRRHRCASCMRDVATCQGHSGHIELCYPMYHLGFMDSVLKTLRVVCFHCSRLCLSDEECERQRQVNMSSRLASANALSKPNRPCPHCAKARPSYTRKTFDIQVTWPAGTQWEHPDEEEYCTRPFTSREATSILRSILPEDMELLGFHPVFSPPVNMMLQNLLVPPPCTRPAIYSSEGSRSRGQNELTVRLLEILRRNTEIIQVVGDAALHTIEVSEDLTERIHRMQYEIFLYINGPGKLQRPPGMGRIVGGSNLKSLSERLKGKEGRVRGNLMGKRVNFSGRCVITPDAYFDVDRVGIPHKIAMKLTVPERVNTTNIHSLTTRVQRGAGELQGALNVIHQNGVTVNLGNARSRRDIVLRPGDVVERFLQDEDVVVFNRQPSLHKYSMQAHRVVLTPGNTFSLGLAAATPYNADFDGDEMNVHVPQGRGAIAECTTLMSVSQNILGDQANKPVVGLVQDALLGMHVLSRQGVFLDREHVCRLLAQTRYAKKGVPVPCARIFRAGVAEQRLWTGKQVISCLLYAGLQVRPHFDSAETDWEDGSLPLTVADGQLVAGMIRKANAGSAAGGLVDRFCRERGGSCCVRFISDAQRLSNVFLLQRGHHVGIHDVMMMPRGQERVNERLSKVTRLCEEIEGTVDLSDSRACDAAEQAVMSLLSKTLRQTGGIVEEEMPLDNAIRTMVTAGSKGSFINLSQICASLGQQSLEGKRIISATTGRTLPCFSHDDRSLLSRGMVYNSFSLGLSPPELFFHAIGGREGLVDTSVKTSQTGYLQRRMNKSMEDTCVKEDGTVCNSMGDVVSMGWGTDGMHPARVERVRLRALEDRPETLRQRLSPEDYEEAIRMRTEILRVKGNMLCNDEVDMRVLLPFHPDRVLRCLHAKGRSDQESDDRESAPDRLTPQEARRLLHGDLLRETKVACVRLALVDLFNDKRVCSLCKEVVASTASWVRDCMRHASCIVGESVGCIAAQSLGEPSTQLTLNTFHTAGCATKNVTLGLPRLREIMDATRHCKTTCTTLRFRDGLRSSDRVADFVSQTLVCVRLRDVVSEVQMVRDPNDDAVPADAWIVNTERVLLSQTLVEKEDRSVIVVRLLLKKDLMKRHRLTPVVVRKVLRERLGDRGDVLGAETNAVEWVVRVRLRGVEAMITRISGSIEDQRVLSHRVIQVLMGTTVLTGHDGVVSTETGTGRRCRVQEGHLTSEEETVVHVYGHDLQKDVATSEAVDWYRSTSNDMWETYELLGIEACANVFFEQLKAVISFDGTYVDDRHLLVLTDTVCRGGCLMPLNRHGINRVESIPLMRASFEETTDVLCNAAIHSEFENARGVSTSIMMGQMSAFGSGMVDVLVPWDDVGDKVTMADAQKRVLRSTCRSHVRDEKSEMVEYVVDPTRFGSVKVPAVAEAVVTDPLVRKRVRFRHGSPVADRPQGKRKSDSQQDSCENAGGLDPTPKRPFRGGDV